MTRRVQLIAIFLTFFGFFGTSYGQFLPSFAIAGGIKAGWFLNPVDELNAQLKSAGFPEMPEGGFFATGGGGFIDLPVKKNFLRIGGFGSGFTSKQTSAVNDTLNKDANYSMGLGGISLEFVMPLGKVVDFSFGTQISTGTLELALYQYGNDFGNYNTIFGEFQSNGSTSNLSRTFTSRFYALQPQIGIGILLKKFMYLKIDCGYQFGTQNTWRVDNDVEVSNFPTGIEPKGLMLSLGLNFGLFIRD